MKRMSGGVSLLLVAMLGGCSQPPAPPAEKVQPLDTSEQKAPVADTSQPVASGNTPAAADIAAVAALNAQFDPARRDASQRDALGIAPHAPLVIYVGRIAAEKNIALAVRAFRALQAQRPDARYVWIGDGPLLEPLRRENPDFVFLGVQRGEALIAVPGVNALVRQDLDELPIVQLAELADMAEEYAAGDAKCRG